MTSCLRVRLMPLALLGVWGASGCDDPTTDRMAWLQQTLIEDNRLLLEREPELTAGKFAKMALHPHRYLRGSLGQYLRDLSQPGPWRARSDFADPRTAWVQLIGDPHLENVGTYFCGDGRMSIEFNDFDASAPGPFYYDVRRLALSVEVAGRSLQAAGRLGRGFAADRRAAVRAIAEGYYDEIRALAAGAPGVRLQRKEGFGDVIDDLLRKAQHDGESRDELDDHTEEVDGVRLLRLGVRDPREAPRVIGDETIALGAAERHLVDALVTGIDAALGRDDAVLGAVRRLGPGVSSYPLPRYLVLLDGPTADPADDLIIEVREATPLPALPVAPVGAAPRFAHDGQRTAVAQRTAQVRPDCDPWLASVELGAQPFRVRSRSGYQRGFDLADYEEDLLDDKASGRDLVDFAHALGRLLARGHALAPTLDGALGLDGLSAVLPDDAARRAAFVNETADFAVAYGAQVMADYAALQTLLADEGPWLGFHPEEAAP